MSEKILVNRDLLLEIYRKGFLDGVYNFAWMKDGTTYVGTTGGMYADVARNPDKEPFFMPKIINDIIEGGA